MTDTNKPNWIGRECKKCWGEGYGQCMCDYGGILEEQAPEAQKPREFWIHSPGYPDWKATPKTEIQPFCECILVREVLPEPRTPEAQRSEEFIRATDEKMREYMKCPHEGVEAHYCPCRYKDEMSFITGADWAYSYAKREAEAQDKKKMIELQERYNEAVDKITELEKDVEQLQKVLSGELKRHTKTLEKVYAMRKHISQMSCCCAGCTKHNLDLEEKNKDTWGESE